MFLKVLKDKYYPILVPANKLSIITVEKLLQDLFQFKIALKRLLKIKFIKNFNMKRIILTKKRA